MMGWGVGSVSGSDGEDAREMKGLLSDGEE